MKKKDSIYVQRLQNQLKSHGLEYMPLDEWKEGATSGEPQFASVLLRKSYITEEIKQMDNEERKIRFVISTGGVDRDRDIINPEGWVLDNFRKNPVVMWAHGYGSPPIARAPETKIFDRKLVSIAEFPEVGLHPFADMIHGLLINGFLNATSVGFKPVKFNLNEDRRGVDFEEQELLEYSVVPVPSNPEALIEARSIGIDMEPLKAWCEQVLDEYDSNPTVYVKDEKTGLFMPRATLEKVFEDLKSEKIIVPDNLDGTTSIAIRNDVEEEEEDDKATHLGQHPTPHDSNGIHQHQGLPRGGGHSHDDATGTHNHREGDPMEGSHSNTGDGSHDHPRALRSVNDDGEWGDKGVAPRSISSEIEPDQATRWQALTLQDFTEERFDELSDSEKRRIARHFAWAAELPPETFGDLKLGHHRASDGAIIWRAVANAGARLPQTDIPAADVSKVQTHLNPHYRAFDKEPPWERSVNEWDAYMAACKAIKEEGAELTDQAMINMLEVLGFADEAEAMKQFEVQSIAFPKDKWTLSEATEWAKDHDFRTDKVDETENFFRFRQREPGEFERLRTICINPGGVSPNDEKCLVQATGGPLKAAEIAEQKEEKRGRTLSAKNEENLKKAVSLISDVLSSLDHEESAENAEQENKTEEEKGNGNGKTEEEEVLTFADEEDEGEEKIIVDEEELKAVVQKSIASKLTGLTGKLPN